MSTKKQFLKTGDICKVTFRLSKEDASIAETVNLAGSFTNWENDAIPMNKLKTGEFTVTVSLPINRSFEYRFIKDNGEWIDDSDADSYTANNIGDHNSVVTTVQ